VTYIWDISNLAMPRQVKQYQASVVSIDHNQYIVDSCSFQSNYASGLRVLQLDGLGLPDTLPREVAYFDVDPDPNHGADFYGSWSVYATFTGSATNTVVIDSIERGLFVLEVDKKALGCH